MSPVLYNVQQTSSTSQGQYLQKKVERFLQFQLVLPIEHIAVRGKSPE